MTDTSLPRTTCRERPLREPQGRVLVELAGRTTERPVRKPVVRGLSSFNDPLPHQIGQFRCATFSGPDTDGKELGMGAMLGAVGR